MLRDIGEQFTNRAASRSPAGDVLCMEAPASVLVPVIERKARWYPLPITRRERPRFDPARLDWPPRTLS
jgi:hypothetical protein